MHCRPVLLGIFAINLALVACGPQPVTRASAERLCAQEAREADGISGTIGVGGGSNGPFAGGSISINSNIANPRTEADALESCVNRRLNGDTGPAQRPRFSISLGAST